MFSDVVLLHGDQAAKNVCSSEKMTQTGDGNVWQPVPPVDVPTVVINSGQQVFFFLSFFILNLREFIFICGALVVIL